jgi:RND family efflux transporter MFP subunit
MKMRALFHRHKKWLLPVGVLCIAYGAATLIRNTGPTLDIIQPETQALTVRVVTAQPQQVRLIVESQGQINAQHMIDLVNEVPGRIERVAQAFVTGGYFKAGDILLELDDTDYELARIRAEALVAEAVEEYDVEKTEAELAKAGLFPLREARVDSARARVQSAQAELAQAEADLKRTRIRAPFDGRVLFTAVDLGQYISKGESVGQIFSTDIAEVRLPLTDQQLRYLDLPFGTGSNDKPLDTPVMLRAEVGGVQTEFQGYLHRMEGAVDPDNRVWYAVARVTDPYGLQDEQRPTPLAVGLFAEAVIQGRTVDNVFKLPRAALRNENDVLIVDAENGLRQRKVEVLRTDFESAFISAGLEPGDRVCVSPVEAFVDGLPVRVVNDAATTDTLAVN